MDVEKLYLLHDLGELGAESLSACFIENLVEHNILKCNKSCFEQVESSLVCKCEYWRCLQVYSSAD